jgi:hypothetical protein
MLPMIKLRHNCNSTIEVLEYHPSLLTNSLTRISVTAFHFDASRVIVPLKIDLVTAQVGSTRLFFE